jgi:ketosteroid isomerase-like protein
MKKLVLSLGLFAALSAAAQDRNEIAVLANVRAVHMAVFQNKDSVALDRLFAQGLSYGHSSGKIENREEAIRNASRNKSVYNDLTMGPVSVVIQNKTAVTRHLMTASEQTADGKLNPLKLHVMMVWVKERRSWKLLSRQAVKVT